MAVFGYLSRVAMPLRALLYRRPVEPTAITIADEHSVYQIRVQRHRQARRYTLRIQSATREVILTVPPRGSLKEARAFAQRHCGWIAARLHRLPEPVPFVPGIVMPLRGEPHRLVHRRGRGTVWAEIGDDGSRALCVAGEEAHIPRRLRDYLKREAKADLEAASRRAADRLGVRIKRVSIRDQASRWGSCSTTGVLSYSWRLVLAPPYVLDYLAAHEVAHLVEMNHSRRFWRLVAKIYPQLPRAKAWLDAHGAELHRYGLTKADARIAQSRHA
jgi:predicted metal-dependent hydrolase